MPQSAYSLDLAPSDYNVFRSMAYFLHSGRFNNQEEVETSEEEFFSLKDKNWYQRGIKKKKKLAERCLQMMQYYSLSFKWLAAFVVTWRIKEISYQNIAKSLTRLTTFPKPMRSRFVERIYLQKIWYLVSKNYRSYIKCTDTCGNYYLFLKNNFLHLMISSAKNGLVFSWDIDIIIQ